MRQLTFLAPGSLAWHEVPEPTVDSPDAALVRPVAVATCDLDTGIVHGHAPLPGPFAFGHEAVAEVVEVGDAVTSVAPGDTVVVPFQISCGHCDRCRTGRTASCRTAGAGAAYGMAPIARREWGGALSDLLAVPHAEAMLVPLPAGIDPVAAASVADNVPDGHRAVAPHLAERPGAPVLVLGGAGAGSVGLYAAGVAVALGSSAVTYVDTDPVRLRAAEALGATAVEREPAGRFERHPIVVHHTASRDGLAAAVRAVEPDGVCVSTGILYEPETPLPLLEMYTTGVTLQTGRVNARATIPTVLDLVASGRLRPELVTHQVVPWDEAPGAVASHTHKTVVARTA